MDGMSQGAGKTDSETPATFGQSAKLVTDAFRSHFPSTNFSLETAGCPVLSTHVDYLDFDVSTQAFCEFLEGVKPQMQTMMMAVYSIAALFLLFGA